MGRKTTILPPSESTTVSRTQAGHASRMNVELGDDPSNPDIRGFMMAVGVQDNVNLQPEAILRRPGVLDGLSLNDPENEDINQERYGDISDFPIEAHLASDEDDIEAMLEERWAARIAQEMEDRTRQETIYTREVAIFNDAEVVVVADEVKDVGTHTGETRQRKWMMAVLLLIFVVGGVVAFLLLRDKDGKQLDGSEALSRSDKPSNAPSFSPVPVDPLVEELRPWIAPTREDLLRFLVPSSPQSQAFAWLHVDPITLTPGRTTRTVLERYVLAVLYFSTSGPSWKFDYLSDDDVCTWNNGLANANYSQSMLGVYCIEDGESVGTLALAENKLRGPLPWELTLLTNLEVIDFGFNSLTGSIPTRIINLTNLQVVFVYVNSLSGPIPADISELTSLERFWVSGNRLTGPLPATISPITVQIVLSENSLTGSIPESWGATMPLLEQCVLSGNDLTGSLPSTFSRLKNLHDLSIDRNLLIGPIPTTLPTSIRTLLLDNNAFTGSIPSTWGTSMPNLNQLSVGENALTGTIPSSLLTGLVRLKSFAADNNWFSGPLPVSFPTGVTELHLEDNRFTGPVPSTWGDSMPNLFFLAIHENSLTGSIPLSLGQISTLTTFTFHSNTLTGSVDFLCDMRDWSELEADCQVPVTCFCCTTCHGTQR